MVPFNVKIEYVGIIIIVVVDYYFDRTYHE